MQIGMMNNPSKPLLQEIDWIVDNNFDFIDLTMEPPKARKFEEEKVKKRLRETGIGIVGHTNPNLPLLFPIESIRRTALDELKKTIETLHFLGAKNINVHPTYQKDLSDDELIFANTLILQDLSFFCHSKGLNLMLENFLPPFDSVEVFKKILNEIIDIKIHLDIGHLNIRSQEPVTQILDDFFNAFAEKIIHLHMHDNRGAEDEHLPIGCGNIDWQSIFYIIRSHGYDGTVTLEVFSPDRDYLLMSREKIREYNDYYLKV